MILDVDGYFCEGQLVFDSPGSGMSSAKGFVIRMPGLENASDAALNRLEDELRVVLRGIKGEVNLQFRFEAGGDYRRELLDYYEDTERLGGPEPSRTLRNQKFTKYWRQLEAGQSRRDLLRIYVNLPGEKQIRSSLESNRQAFAHYERLFNQTFSRMGGGVQPLDDQGHFEDYLRFFNRSRDVREHTLDPLKSIQENCFLCEAVPVKEGGVSGFWLDGQYHGLLVIQSLPQATLSGMIQCVTGLPLLDYAMTVNVRPLDVGTEIRKEEAACEKLQNALRHNPKVRMQASVEIRQQRIRRLLSDEVVPFEAQFILHAWAPTLAGLQEKLSTLESAIVKMNGANYYHPAFPPSARNCFLITLPGWTRSRYRDHALLLEDHHLANLLPVAGSSTGDLENAEAIYPGRNGNLVGIKTFAGEEASPQHALVTGLTGSGKSVLLSDLLLQTEGEYAYTAIVDDGMAHAGYIESVSESRSIVIRPEGDVTINYLDTNRLPLSPSHLGDVAAMIGIMTETDSAEQRAIVSEALQLLYDRWYERWAERHSETLSAVARCGLLLEGSSCATLTEGFLEWQEFESHAEDPSQKEVLAYLEKNRNTQRFRRLVFAFMESHEMPTHSNLVDWLEKQNRTGSRNREAFGRLATLLAPWRSNGNYGDLVDGITNVNLSGSHVHIELSKIPESAKQLRALAAFLITNHIRNHIMSLPRQLKKRVVLEELNGFENIPGGSEILAEFYSRMRKYSTWVIAVIQQLEMLKDSPARASLLGNSRIGIFLKQANPSELDLLSESFSSARIDQGNDSAFQRTQSRGRGSVYLLPQRIDPAHRDGAARIDSPGRGRKTIRPKSRGRRRAVAHKGLR